MQEAAKPVRITGALTDSILRLRLSEVSSDQDASQRFEVRHRNSGDGPPLPRSTPRDALILVVAFDRLLKIADQTWREFARDYWVDGPLGWSGGEPSSEWAQNFRFPPDVTQDVGGIVHIGYRAGAGLRSAFVRSAWGGPAGLLRLPVSWVALQFADVARALDPRLPNLTTLGVRDFADTARVLLELDAVVTIDTAVAHLAGTIGRPTRLLLVHPAHPISDGRWYDRPPLYAAVRVTTQARVGDWSAAIEAARLDVQR